MTKVMKFDDVLLEIGEFGKYQKWIYFLLIFPWTLSGPFMVLSVFVLGVPDYRCAIPGFENDSYVIQGDAHQQLVNRYIPLSSDDDELYDRCHVYHFDNSLTHFDNDSPPVNATLTKCHSWVYSRDVFDDTFVIEEDLVCDSKYKTSLSKTIFFGGILVGSFIFGVISDTLGRRRTLLIAILFLFVSSLSLAWSNSYITFVVLRFFIGVCNVGMFMTAYVIGMEWVGTSKRTFVGLGNSFIGTFGGLYILLVAYFLRKWNYIIIASAIPIGLLTQLWWLVPESPRWLCSKGRINEAQKLLKHAACVNKTELPDKILNNLAEERKQVGRVWLLFSDKKLGFRTFVIYLNWMVVCMIFFGLTLNTGSLYGDYYINFLITTLVEFPGRLLPIIMINRIGRKKSHFMYMFFGGVACLSTIFTVNFGGKDLQILTTVLAMFGKLFATAAFATIYIFSAELFPTAVRNVGMGTSSCWARVGGMISPFITDATDLIGGKVGKAAPLVIFGGASLIAAGLTLTLPETLNKHLPETIEDGKKYHKKEYKEMSREAMMKKNSNVVMTKF